MDDGEGDSEGATTWGHHGDTRGEAERGRTCKRERESRAAGETKRNGSNPIWASAPRLHVPNEGAPLIDRQTGRALGG